MKKFYYNWLILITSYLFGAYWMHEFGIFGLIWDYDVTKVTYITMALFLIATGFMGYSTVQFVWDKSTIQMTNYRLDIGHFIANSCMKLGLIGTAIGISLMSLNIFSNISDAASVIKIMPLVGKSLGPIFFTTIVGSATSLLLEAQCANLSYAVGKYQESNDFPY